MKNEDQPTGIKKSKFINSIFNQNDAEDKILSHNSIRSSRKNSKMQVESPTRLKWKDSQIRSRKNSKIQEGSPSRLKWKDSKINSIKENQN